MAIPKPIDRIAESDLQDLVTLGASEDFTLEFKRAVSLENDDAKREFYKDVTALANARGGDLIIGVDTAEGKASHVLGWEGFVLDRTISQITQLLHSAVEPQLLGLSIHPVLLRNKKHVLVIRLQKSWNGPHVVKGKNNVNHFFIRDHQTSREMHMNEIREAFALSGTVADRIKQFRSERIESLRIGNAPRSLKTSSGFLAHILPLVSFSDRISVDIEVLRRKSLVTPMRTSNWEDRLNLDGLLAFSPVDGLTDVYVQFFRNGCFEYFDSNPLFYGNKTFDRWTFEKRFAEFVTRAEEVYSTLDIAPPYFLCVTLMHLNGHTLATGRQLLSNHSIDRDVAALPESYLTGLKPTGTELTDIFKQVFHCFGIARSPNLDSAVPS